jgi:CRISP-associated protein Cas1
VAWKGVHLTKPARLSLADTQLVVDQDAQTRIALEDIAWIIIDDPRITLTAKLLSACMTAGIALVVTDERHTPSGMALPFHTHHRQAAVAATQLAVSLPLKKRLWQSIVRSKIENQAACLVGLERNGAEKIAAMSQRVGSGDPDNTEARAARAYWGALFNDFTRSDETDRRNKMLNYGYAVVRASVARALVGAGFMPCVGVHHASITNGFNLADDIFEPFRPFVDAAVFQELGAEKSTDTDLSITDRRGMAGILLREALLNGEGMTVLTATERVASSLVRAMEAGDPKSLMLPRFVVSPREACVA